MVLTGIKILHQGKSSIIIGGEKIKEVISHDNNQQTLPKGPGIYMDGGAYAFPGLINSHDHLDFNLFPSLRNGIYKNYMEWGADIHQRNKQQIDKVLDIPKSLRIQWGIYKNLISGITTVVQHGERFQDPENLINIFSGDRSLHSVGLEKRWKLKLNRPFRGDIPFVIHIGEGTDTKSKKEINEILRWNLFDREIIAVHGLTMDKNQAGHFKALVWCPYSNYFLYGDTPPVNELKKHTSILFGTDATVSAHWNIWQHLRLARKTHLLNDTELINSVGSSAADIWGLKNTGRIEMGYDADIIIVKPDQSVMNEYDHFFNAGPEQIMLILCKGKITFFDHCLLHQIDKNIVKNYSRVYINGKEKFILGGLAELIKTLKNYGSELTMPVTIEA